MQLTTLRQAVGYRRVSGKSQKDNFSLDSQAQDIRDYAEAEGIPFGTMFTDVGSGLSIKQRPEFQRMISNTLDGSEGNTDIVFWDLDRFTRNIEQFFTFTKPLLLANITLHLALDGEKFDYNSEERWYQRLIAAQAESKKISRRTKRGQRTATREGRHVGQPPWGYWLVYDTEEKNEKGEPMTCGRLAPDPETWEHCLMLWRLAEDGLTPMRIARHMNQQGIPSPSGGVWTDGCVRYILKNNKYHGQLFRGVNPQSRLPGPKEDAPAIIVDNAHEPAVSFETFQKISEGIKSRHREQGATRSHSSPNPLSGSIKCGECKIQGFDSNLELHRQNGSVRLRCSRKKKMGGKEVCAFTSARFDVVIQEISRKLLDKFLTEERLESIADAVAEDSRDHLDRQEASRTGLTANLKILNNQAENVLSQVKGGDAGPRSRNFLMNDLERILEEKEEVEQTLSRMAEADEQTLLFVNDREGVIETALNLKTYTDPEDPEAIRELMQVFIDRVELFQDGNGYIQYNLTVHSSEPGNDQPADRISFKKRQSSGTNENCGLAQSTGIDPASAYRQPQAGWIPRRRGDRPQIEVYDISSLEDSPQARG